MGTLGTFILDCCPPLSLLTKEEGENTTSSLEPHRACIFLLTLLLQQCSDYIYGSICVQMKIQMVNLHHKYYRTHEDSIIYAFVGRTHDLDSL